VRWPGSWYSNRDADRPGEGAPAPETMTSVNASTIRSM
jgi:hypothetical protein